MSTHSSNKSHTDSHLTPNHPIASRRTRAPPFHSLSSSSPAPTSRHSTACTTRWFVSTAKPNAPTLSLNKHTDQTELTLHHITTPLQQMSDSAVTVRCRNILTNRLLSRKQMVRTPRLRSPANADVRRLVAPLSSGIYPCPPPACRTLAMRCCCPPVSHTWLSTDVSLHHTRQTTSSSSRNAAVAPHTRDKRSQQRNSQQPLVSHQQNRTLASSLSLSLVTHSYTRLLSFKRHQRLACTRRRGPSLAHTHRHKTSAFSTTQH
jgi:hypothetical protein